MGVIEYPEDKAVGTQKGCLEKLNVCDQICVLIW